MIFLKSCKRFAGATRHPLARIGAALAAVLAFSAAAAAQGEAFVVAPRLVDDLKAVYATVESIDQTQARTRIGGTLRDLSVDEGSQVSAGEPIARIEDAKLTLELAALDARIGAAESQQKLAEVDRKRVATLRERGTVSQAALDDADTALEVARGNLAALRAERAVVAERRREGAVLAPAGGRVLSVPVTEGQVLMAGETVAVIAAEAYILRLHLPERHARFLKEGDPVLVGARGLGEDALEAGDERLREGLVRQVYPELERGRVVADVAVEALGDYFVGERTRVYVSAGQREAIVVPQDYLYERSGLTYVELENLGHLVVQPGRPTADGIEILSGVKPGDRLVKPVWPAAGARP